MADWNPESYARFRDLRLRPALDLLARVFHDDARLVVDLGCGNGAVAEALRARFPVSRLVGVDNSPAMLEEAAARGIYDDLACADVAGWTPADAPDVIFSNAALQWLPDHAALFPALVARLAPGGVFAVQMPRQYGAPSHRFLRDFAADMFPDRFAMASWQAPVDPPVDYARLLAPLGELDLWETDYIQRLAPTAGGHPVRAFTEATAMRPFVERMSAAESSAYIARYDAALAAAYPPEADGSVLFPFRRLFMVVSPQG